MTFDVPARAPKSALILLLLVGSAVAFQLGLVITQVFAVPTLPGPSPPSVLFEPDLESDRVAAIAAEFRVNESGAATYSVPLYTVPGTAGVVPKISLDYSS